MNEQEKVATADIATETQKEQQYHPYRLLGVIAFVTGSLAILCYGLQVYFIG